MWIQYASIDYLPMMKHSARIHWASKFCKGRPISTVNNGAEGKRLAYSFSSLHFHHHPSVRFTLTICLKLIVWTSVFLSHQWHIKTTFLCHNSGWLHSIYQTNPSHTTNPNFSLPYFFTLSLALNLLSLVKTPTSSKLPHPHYFLCLSKENGWFFWHKK